MTARVATLAWRIEDDGIESPRRETSSPSERDFDCLGDEAAARVRHSTETQARFAVGDCGTVLFDGHDCVAAQGEGQREEAGTRIQIQD